MLGLEGGGDTAVRDSIKAAGSRRSNGAPMFPGNVSGLLLYHRPNHRWRKTAYCSLGPIILLYGCLSV